ncbi:hypothetical protein H2200_005048 [Cladophialophora chaetospira]|uniref:Uncharacterized protein n=1 Tax=Cladophialophora chaetospira TaxID=386627 RepID=A0AA38XBU8_9EURO|nr:hypothetical protein H2200_005048 [Cladophialophora chaetospira]
MSALDWALPPRTASPPVIPFRFFDLPQEIQDKVYEIIYAEKHGVSVHISGPLQDRGRGRRGYGKEVEVEKLHINGGYYGDDGLKRACKKMRNDSFPARKAVFNKKMSVGWDEDYRGQAFEELRAEKYAKLRSEITHLSIGEFSGRTCGELPSVFWDDIHTLFPQVKTIKASYGMYRRQHVDRDFDDETSEWRRIMADDYDDAFRAGDMDDEFDFPAERLQLLSLARTLEEAAHGCTVFLTTSVTWTDNRYHAVHWQHIKFLVTADGVEGIERKP